jgi:glycosyltransferase involved in cell wall biosynthesis
MNADAPKLRVGFLTTHPIQYQAPVFRALAQTPDIDLTVYFCLLPNQQQQGAEFGVAFSWDIPLLEGYAHRVLPNVSPHPSVTRFSGCDTPGVAAQWQRDRLDAVIINGWVVKSCLQGMRACRKLQIPCLVRGEANVLRPRAWWKRLLHRRLLRQYSRYLYIGESNREFYRRHGAREEQLYPALYCVDNDFFARAAEQVDRAAVRAQWGLDDGTVCYLYCGKFIPKKHPLELLQSFGRAVAQGARAQLLMVGAGELLDPCRRLAESERLPVTFTGFLNQSQIVAAYVAADCLVLPSDHGETWGLVVNEAMACGRPALVSSQTGCGPDLIQPGVTGDVFEFGDWGQLADRLRTYSQDRERLQSMGAAARRRVAAYSPLAAAEGIAQAVRSTTSRAHG